MKFAVPVVSGSFVHGIFNQLSRRALASVLNIFNVVMILGDRLLLFVLIKFRKFLFRGAFASLE